MKRITSWNDLQGYGIVFLTGESCGLSYRLLCDVTERGRWIIGKTLGLADLRLLDNWNQGSADDPHVGSILLPPAMFVPLAVFALLESGCTEVWLYRNDSLLGIEPTDSQEQIALRRNMAPETLVRTFAYRGTCGDRNMHMMSKRVS